jgi:opacity protein-like surface antigen
MSTMRIPRSWYAALAALLVISLCAAETAEARRRYRRGTRVRYGYRVHYTAAGTAYYGPSGWYGGIGLGATKIVDQRGGPEALADGVGVSLYGGLRLADRFALELGYLGSFHNPATVTTYWGRETDFLVLEAFTADARVYLDRSGNLDPYLQAGLGLYVLGSEHFGVDAVGTGFQLGGGFDFYLNDYWFIGLRALYRGIAMGPPEGGQADTFISGATVEGSVGIHF